MKLGLEKKSALVTGGGSGIGAAICRELAAEGAAVLVADLSAAAANEVADEIRKAGGRAEAFAVDVAEPVAVETMVSKVVELFGRLDLAVNNAGIGSSAVPLGEVSVEDWRKVVDVNLNGVFYGLRSEIPAMLRTGGGAIVNMSSILGSVGFGGAAAYVAAKHALLGLTRTAALDHGAQNIRVNAVGPAFINTPLLAANLDATALAGLAGLHPMNRLGTPEEVSALTVFLLSERASFINGSYHLVDGGYTSR